jgi:hypothetical protein
VDGKCCGTACTEACATCAFASGAPSDGTCGPRTAGTEGDCFPYLCDGTSTTCPTSCATSGCVSTYVCNSATQKCVGSNGQACLASSDCLSGICADGFCCGSPCGGCYACAQSLTGLGNGTCAVVMHPSDPHDFCPQDPGYPASCGADGFCSIRGECNQFASASTTCGDLECDANGAVVLHICDGAGTCTSEATQCSPGICFLASCSFGCSTDADCNAEKGFCDDDGICQTQGLDGVSCAKDRACKSGHCANSLCCQTACADGARCVNGVAYTADHCDGTGTCQVGSPTPCGAYACDATACKQSCASHDDCVLGARCVEGKCIAEASCDGDHTLQNPSGELTDCSPYRCTQAGTCHSTCGSSLQCVDGQMCNSSARCVPRKEAEDDPSCGCRVPRDDTNPWPLLFVLVCALWRRQRTCSRHALDRARVLDAGSRRMR